MCTKWHANSAHFHHRRKVSIYVYVYIYVCMWMFARAKLTTEVCYCGSNAGNRLPRNCGAPMVSARREMYVGWNLKRDRWEIWRLCEFFR